MQGKRQPLGQLLVKRGILLPAQLRELLQTQVGSGRRLASEVLARGIADQHTLLSVLGFQVGVPGVDLSHLVLPLTFLDVLPQAEAQRRRALPVWVDAERIFVALSDPQQEGFEAELTFLSRRQVVLCVALDSALEVALTAAYEAKARGELEYRGGQAEGLPAGELQLIHSEEMTHVPKSLLPDGSAATQKSASGVIEIDVLGDELAGDVPIDASLPSIEMLAEPPEPLRRHVLVVDDDEELARLVARLLESRGYAVTLAHRGLEALSRLKERPPDLLILDAMLPELHGFDIAQKVKRSERYQHIPIIMMSSVYRGWRIAEDLKESYQVEAFIEKPFQLDAMAKAVERVLLAHGRDHRRRKMSSGAFRAFKQGIDRYKGQDLDGAIESIREGLRVDPLSAKLHFQLGVLCLKKRGMVYPAMQAFEEAALLEPDFFAALRSLAILYQRKGFRNKAIDAWERALRCSPDDATAAEVRGHLLTLL